MQAAGLPVVNKGNHGHPGRKQPAEQAGAKAEARNARDDRRAGTGGILRSIYQQNQTRYVALKKSGHQSAKPGAVCNDDLGRLAQPARVLVLEPARVARRNQKMVILETAFEPRVMEQTSHYRHPRKVEHKDDDRASVSLRGNRAPQSLKTG